MTTYYLVTAQQQGCMITTTCMVEDFFIQSNKLQEFLRKETDLKGDFNIIFLMKLTKQEYEIYNRKE